MDATKITDIALTPTEPIIRSGAEKKVSNSAPQAKWQTTAPFLGRSQEKGITPKDVAKCVQCRMDNNTYLNNFVTYDKK